MALQRLTIDGYGQLEINAFVAPRAGKVEAQCKLNETDFADEPAEVGMLLAVDNINRRVKLPVAGEAYPIAINYSAEILYDDAKKGLKNFAQQTKDFMPRMGYLTVGDKFHTNTVCYDTAEFKDDEALKAALKKEALKTAPVYGCACELGAIKLTKTAPEKGLVFMVACESTMPDGQYAVKLHCIKE